MSFTELDDMLQALTKLIVARYPVVHEKLAVLFA